MTLRHAVGSRGRGFVLLLAAVALLAGSCNAKSSPTKPGTVTQGGNIVVAAEQEPECMDWIGSCAGSAWGMYMVETNTMPRAYDYTDKGYQPSILLTGPAVLETTPQQVVTYHINPKAVWSDGQPITSQDFEYTWDQIANGDNIYDRSGYNQIVSVNDTDPHTAIVTFSSPYPDWQVLFGGSYGIFPSHLLAGNDRDSLMKNGYSFSGGPWVLDHWARGNDLELVPNRAYWGKKPNLASVTFRFITDPATEQAAYRSGQVAALYPQPEPGVAALKDVPGTFFGAVTGLSYEAIWFNVEQAPLDSSAVRQALAYATDRTAIVRQLLAPIEPGIQPINSMYTPAFGSAYSDPFAEYQRNLDMVDQLMTGDGWAKGSNGVWAKDGVTAMLDIKTTSGSQRRQLMAQLLQRQWQTAGFAVTVTLEPSTLLFGQDLPSGNFTVALYGQTAVDDDPGECVIWCSKNIPTQADLFTGQNWVRIDDPTLDQPWLDADTNLDQSARITDAHTGQAVLAQLVPALPLDALPDILVVNTDQIGVEGGTFQHNLAYGPFTYLNTWYLK